MKRGFFVNDSNCLTKSSLCLSPDTFHTQRASCFLWQEKAFNLYSNEDSGDTGAGAVYNYGHSSVDATCVTNHWVSIMITGVCNVCFATDYLDMHCKNNQSTKLLDEWECFFL